MVLYCNREVVAGPARDEFGLEAPILHLGGDLALHHPVRLALALRRFEPDAFLVGTFRKLWLAALGARLAGVPRVVARIGLSTDTPRNAKYRFVFRHWVDRVVVNARDLRRTYMEELPGFPPEHLVTIYKGFAAPEPSAPPGAVRRELGIPPDAPVVGTLARLVRQKRLDRLLEVVALLPSAVHCVVAGDGPLRGELEARAGELGVTPRVHFLGHRSDVPDVLAALDLLVLTSDRESLANAMLEAMAAGVPVLSTPVSGAREALEPLADGRRPGLVVDPEPESLARAVDELLEDPERREGMARAARERIRERFDREEMLDRWEAVLKGQDGP